MGILIGIASIIFAVWSVTRSGCSISSKLNPDLSCRVLDTRGDRQLIEYFDVDTNDLHLHVQEAGKDMLIEHPYGKVKGYQEKIDLNRMEFDPTDVNFIIVNGERFRILPQK